MIFLNTLFGSEQLLDFSVKNPFLFIKSSYTQIKIRKIRKKNWKKFEKNPKKSKKIQGFLFGSEQLLEFSV